MLIVCTKDNSIIAWTQNIKSDGNAWSSNKYISIIATQAQANHSLSGFLANVQPSEPLCFSAHGSNKEIGDSGSGPNEWTWKVSDLAALMYGNLPANYKGNVLIHTCATSVVNFSANLAASLSNLKVFKGIWIYGYNRAVGLQESYPSPTTLDKNVSLQLTQVQY